MLVNIWVKDNFTGDVHQVGTDPHDSLDVVDGRVEYLNLQNGCGTLGDTDGYSFIEEPADSIDDYVVVTPDVLRVNREHLHKDVLRMLEEHPEIFEDDDDEREDNKEGMQRE